MEQQVIELHNIARLIEQKIGIGTLSKSIRESADKLSEVINGYRRTN